MPQDLKDLLVPFKRMEGATIPVLQKVQEEYGYLSERRLPSKHPSMRFRLQEKAV